MDSRAAHRALKTTGSLLLLAAVAAPGAGFPQTAPAPAAGSEQQQLVEEIRERQSQDGIVSPTLIGPLSALGLTHQEQGDHALAASVLERARHVVRVNYGLHSLREAPLIRQLIRSELARGNAEAGWALEQELLRRVRRHPDDLRTVPVLRAIADRRMDILSRYEAGEFPPEIILGCYYNERRPDGGRRCHAGSRGRAMAGLLGEAQSYYSEAIRVILRAEGYSNDELPELLMTLVEMSYEHGRYGTGRKALRYLYSHKVANGEPLPIQLEALVQIADWDLLFARSGNLRATALEIYEHAYGQLEQPGTEQAPIDRIFSPEIPAVIPRFRSNPLATEAGEHTGYIDVAFDITEDGESERIEILDATTGATDADRERLVDLIDHGRFRPRVRNGQVETSARVHLRYYLP